MKQPSIVSSRLIPAANRIGRVRIAYHGSENAAAPPASTSRPTSVAVSKPRPNSSADRVHLPGLGDRLGGTGEDAVHEAALVELLLERAPRRNVPRRIRRNTFDDADEDDQVDDADDVEEHAGDGGADQRRWSAAGWRSRSRPARRARGRPTASRRHSANTIEEWPEGEPEADRQRALALGHQLAGGVVDRGDVVGVEGVPHPQGVGGDAEADAEDLMRADLVVVRCHQPASTPQPTTCSSRMNRPRPASVVHSRRLSAAPARAIHARSGLGQCSTGVPPCGSGPTERGPTCRNVRRGRPVATCSR